MYNLEFLPVALQDMVEIAQYISQHLKNPMAAENLAMELIEAGESIRMFPYANPAHRPIRPLKYEYRKLLIQNYLIFYRVDEGQKLITVARVIYAKRKYDGLLD